ncbi:MAG: polysaccharide deacetylase [Oscillospiraceae bacterium]|nr:polysaccharide deacetylase [Oscillospiraceae bacterium]
MRIVKIILISIFALCVPFVVFLIYDAVYASQPSPFREDPVTDVFVWSRQDSVALGEPDEPEKPDIPEEPPEPPLPDRSVPVAFLTFDDGPSKYTERILEILEEHEVKATFFVIDKPMYDDLYKTIYDSGNEIALHSASHEYKQIYGSEEAFFEDYYSLQNKIYDLIGVRLWTYRFPGGTSNTIVSRTVLNDIFVKLRAKNIKYIDWNVSSNDCNVRDSNKIINNVVKGAKETVKIEKNNNEAMILLHDTNLSLPSVNALSEIITQLKEEGFVFDTVSNATNLSQHRKLAE